MAQRNERESAAQIERTALSSVSTEEANPRQKRRKIAIACEPCRTRKSRCDGERPVCGPCRNRPSLRHVCVYGKQPQQETREGDTSQNALLDRIKNLERLLELSSGLTSNTPRPVLPLEALTADEARTAPGNSQAPSADNNDAPFKYNAVELGQRDSAQVLPQGAIHAARLLSQPNSPSSFPLPDQNQASISQTPSSAVVTRSAISFQGGDPHDNTRAPGNEPSPVNGMGSASYLDSRAASPSNAFYGGSSTAFFMRQVRETIPNRPLENSSHISPGKEHTSAIFPNGFQFSPISALSEDIELPSRDLADQLMEIYWTRSHTLYPFVFKSIFTQAYEDLWKPRGHIYIVPERTVDLGLGSPGISDSRSVVFHCALNSIFALACQLDITNLGGRDRHSLSDTFFLRSKKLLHIDIFNSGTLSFVQALLIMTQFLQSTSFPSRCWNALGFACRIAQGLGLHVELPRSKRLETEVEARRRTWHGCVIMDIVIGMTLGRPTMTPVQILIPQPSALEEDLLPLPSELAPHFEKRPTTIEFYVETIKLYSILSKILANVYKPWSGTSAISQDTKDGHWKKGSDSQFDLGTLLSLDDEMSAFENNISPWLHWQKGVELRSTMPHHARQTLDRQSNVLFIRYHHIRLLLNRPSFLRFYYKLVVSAQAKGTQAENSASSIGKASNKSRTHLDSLDIQASIACIDAATEIIRGLNESVVSSSYGAWWYAAFYIYTAGMVLILAESCTPMHEYFGLPEIEKSWRICCDTLRHLTQISPLVRHTLDGLIKMQQKLASRPPTRLSNTPSSGVQTNTASNGSTNKTWDNGSRPSQQHETGVETLRLVELQQTIGNPHDMGSNDFAEGVFAQSSSAQPWMDFIMQDMDMMPLDHSDEVWWHLQL